MSKNQTIHMLQLSVIIYNYGPLPQWVAGQPTLALPISVSYVNSVSSTRFYHFIS